MKLNFWLLQVLLALVMTSCFQDECNNTQIFYQYDPIYISKAEIKNAFKIESNRTLKESGKIYVYGNYLLINEPTLGVHIVNNADPKNPRFISFINIPGNMDLSVVNDILYVDNYTDLLSIDISNPNSPQLLCRVDDVFKPILIDPIRGLLVGYKQTELTRELSCSDPNFGNGWFREGDVIFSKRGGPTANNSGGNGPGIGGSTSRFTIYSDYLYTVDYSELYAFNIEKDCPKLLNKVQVGWNIETIYPYNDFLFIGSSNGMFMYGLKDPTLPNFISSVSHWRSCDPVVAEGNTAYVTLHGGTACGGFSNQLDIIDVKNIYSPYIVKTFPMTSPRGLAIVNNTLYICDNGLKIFNATDRTNIDMLIHEKIGLINDIIVYPDEDHCILTGEDGIRQYSIDNKKNISLLSHIQN